MGKNGMSEAERAQKARAMRLRRLRGIYGTVPGLFVDSYDAQHVQMLVDRQIALLGAETEELRRTRRHAAMQTEEGWAAYTAKYYPVRKPKKAIK